MKKKLGVLLAGIFGLLFLKFEYASASADFGQAAVLPKGRHQVVFRFGNKKNVQQKYADGGELQDVNRLNTRMDNRFLKSIEKSTPEGFKYHPFGDAFKKINDQMFPNQKIADDFDMGSLEFRGKAQFDYFTPQVARGITNRWTLGFAVPIVSFKSSVEAYNGGTNRTNEVFSKIASPDKVGDLSPELAYLRGVMLAGPKALFETQREEAGYKEVNDRDLTFVGDVIIGSAFKVTDTKYWDLYLQNYVVLPTGPQDDPDDLVDPSVFHKTKLETALYNNVDLSRWMQLGTSIGYNWNIEDSMVKRVPRFEGDILPPASTKERVTKDPGDDVVLKLHTLFTPIRDAEFGIGYEKTFSQSDRYSGGRGQNYTLLEKNTQAEFDTIRFKASYTTLDSFVQGTTSLPISFTYAYADIISGKNVEREQTHELLMKMYF